VLKVFVNHYNEQRPHRALSLAPPSHDIHGSRRRLARFVSTVATVSAV